MMKFVEFFNCDMDKLVEVLFWEYGKILLDVKGDVICGLEVVEFCIGVLYFLKGEFIEGVGLGIDMYFMCQFLGVVVGIILFNFLVMILMWKFCLVFVCGNVFILKLFEWDLFVLIMLVELMIEVGFLVGLFNVVNGDKGVVDVIFDDEIIQVVGFVGFMLIVQYVYFWVMVLGKCVQCFGGVKNYMIIMLDVDFDQVVDVFVGVGYGVVGECCMVVFVVVFVGESMVNVLIEKLVFWVEVLKIGLYMVGDDVDFGLLVIKDVLICVRGLVD